jgi:phage terminase large subunit
MEYNLPYKFTPRSYQVEPWNAIMHENFMRGVMVVPRRNGKDLTCWNALVCKAFQKVGLYYYMAPYYNQVRQIIWEGFDKSGRRFLDYIPVDLITAKTKLDMRIDLVNGSQIKLQGSDNIDRIVGTNPRGVVFTEFSLHKPGAWDYLRPVLAENGGWAIFNGTPRGMNHLFELYQKANAASDWYSQYLTRDDTGIPTLDAIEEDRKSGMPDALIQQEYYCSWMAGSVGSYYGQQMEELRKRGQIANIPREDSLKTYTFWDLGVADTMAIWFVQFFLKEIRVIDYYANEGEGMVHYIKMLTEKPYVYEEHFAPHDINVRELTTGVSRRQRIFQEHGLHFNVLPKWAVVDGIEATREILPRCWFDSNRCNEGILALTHYRKRYDEKRRVLRG